ncbi:hypothetical protein C943_03816 [Mariniradius saccharolyticus AK6]|uniref:Uncharacterized protein n=1 Tax=Mariniradius saccharolyticus AK6 TaxID=1239962 RepID=M7X9B3_9BACT|nr:hypothetical protein C943_03816 [Mariniradius saccharolyticus AK6]
MGEPDMVMRLIRFQKNTKNWPFAKTFYQSAHFVGRITISSDKGA